MKRTAVTPNLKISPPIGGGRSATEIRSRPGRRSGALGPAGTSKEPGLRLVEELASLAPPPGDLTHHLINFKKCE